MIVGMFNKGGVHKQTLVNKTVCMRDGHRAIGKHNHMRHARTWLTPASSSEFGKADGFEAEEDSSGIFLCAFGFEARTNLGHDMEVATLQGLTPGRPGRCAAVGLPVQAPGSENANILPIYWQYIAILPNIGILPIYCQYTAIWLIRTSTPYCGPQWSHHVQSVTSRARFDFFWNFFLGKILSAQEASNTTIKPVRDARDRNQESYWQYIGNILPN
jgi:hypothetical protein